LREAFEEAAALAALALAQVERRIARDAWYGWTARGEARKKDFP
jgi:hypothetical protein